MNNKLSVFSNETALRADLAKSFLFKVEIKPQGDGSMLKQLIDTYNANGWGYFTLRARSASIPNKTFSEMFTEFNGTKLVMPGKATVDGDLTIKFDEFQDLAISKFLHSWQQLMFNTNNTLVDADEADIYTTQAGNKFIEYAAKITVRIYDSSKSKFLPLKYIFQYCFPKDVNAAELDMEGDSKIQRTAVFKYSTYNVVEDNMNADTDAN